MTARRSAASLDGITVGIPATRRAKETAELVTRRGGHAIVGPTLFEIPLLEDVELKKATERVVASPAGWSIHLTGVGTHRWIEAADGWGLKDSLLDVLARAQVVARGGKAKSALAAYGLAPVWVPPGETSDEIRDWIRPKLAAGDVVALQLHGSPVPALEHAIDATGAETVEVSPYRWDLPTNLAPARGLIAAALAGELQALVITSAPQIRHLFVVAAQMGLEEQLRHALRERVFVAAVGTVARGGIEEQGLSADLVANPPRMGALIRELAGSRERILHKASPMR